MSRGRFTSCVVALALFGTSCGDDAVPASETSSSPTTASAGEADTTVSSESEATSIDPDRSSGAIADVGIPVPPSWDPDAIEPPCRADDPAPLLDDALDRAGLSRETFRFAEADFAESSQWNAGVLGGDFAFSWLWDVRADAARIGCFEGRVAGGLDHALAQPHPIASAIRHVAGLVDRPVDDAAPFAAADFAVATDELCTTVGGCGPAEGTLPDDLADALAPIVRAVHAGVQARLDMDAEPGGDPVFWHEHGGNMTLVAGGPSPLLSDSDVRAYLLGQGARVQLYGAAARLAFAIEDVDWSAFAGREGIEYTLVTPAGIIAVRDASDHVYPEDGPQTLLLVDLGGADTHLDEVASNRGPANPVSVAIDLGGADVYGYDEVPSEWDGPGLLPADGDGRQAGDGFNGPTSRSKRFRQGAARNGIAMLFDLGTDDDRYTSLRGSQGYAHLGVGVAFDAGGHDTWAAEANAQGAAQFGIGLLVDASGDDTYRAFTQAQGFGFVGAAGVLVDGGGEDAFDCDVGDPAYGGVPLYYSPQLPDAGNTSMCQGAGYGARSDNDVSSSLSGGLGVLRDVAGDDTYDASVFAQGTGYWEGVGLLADGDGVDRYDAFWYVRGGAAHYAVGVLTDAGDGADRYGTERANINVTLGGGHDFSLGALIDEGGADEYIVTGLSAGASNCNGIGVIVDHAGDDTYEILSLLAAGVGNISAECIGARPDATSIGVMIDAGGMDTYEAPMVMDSPFVVPTEGGVWGYAAAGMLAEHGAGLDGDGEAGIHAEAGR